MFIAKIPFKGGTQNTAKLMKCLHTLDINEVFTKLTLDINEVSTYSRYQLSVY